MKLKNEFEPIRNWAKEKGILDKGDVKTQYVKLQEEAGELAKALLKNDKPEIIDGLGDCVVVLVNLAKLAGYNLEDCINEAYSVISNRKGQMEGGTFVKNEKKIVTALMHKNGYYNLPCKFTDINKFLEDHNIKVDNIILTSEDNLHKFARPSKQKDGSAYFYKSDMN